ncbi:hypothetical protein [Cupriavidus sp. BIC8F]|uniref:hypothetical protein n=1 Tax=Cupriavidus sp. BIC8F TaxID=3079014 RepID=UPI002916AF33|nr:hypothetical protein [Cupriavidus sp. BIC8F]
MQTAKPVKKHGMESRKHEMKEEKAENKKHEMKETKQQGNYSAGMGESTLPVNA